jgi:hypothetical protein
LSNFRNHQLKMQKSNRHSLLFELRFSPLLAVILIPALLSNSWSSALAKPTRAIEAPETTPGVILLSTFYSFPQDAWTQVNWETALEINIQGFNLYRRLNPDEAWVQVNEQLIVAANPGGFETAKYTWLDTGVQPGLFYEYLLEGVDSSGRTHQYGPSGTSPARLVFKLLFLPVVQH